MLRQNVKQNNDRSLCADVADATNDEGLTAACADKGKPAAVGSAKRVSGFVDNSTYSLVDPKDFDGEPFVVDGQVVKDLVIRKLKPMEMLDANIQELGEGNIGAVVEMLQRCCTPSLTAEDVNNLDLPVVLEASGVLKGFFLGTQLKASGKSSSA